jgi:nitrate reductase gamma subunit
MILSIYAYVSIFIFIVVIAYRLIKIASTPVHLRWELYPVPHETGGKARYGGSYLEEPDWWTKHTEGSKIGELGIMIPEIFLLKGVWEYNRSLWFWSWSFHTALYATALAAFILIFASIINPASAPGAALISLTGVVCTIGYSLGIIGCLGMLYKRLADDKMKRFTSPAAIFNLLFILAIFTTGVIALFKVGGLEFSRQLQQHIMGLFTLSATSARDMTVSLHIAVALTFLSYLPFTHMIHFVTKYFTYHSVRWNDQPNLRGSKIEKEVNEALKLKPTWSAKHIKADGKKNWVDIATEEMTKNDKKA